jgi:bleomycin hydrolase
LQILLSCWLANKFFFQLREYAKYLADMVAEEVDSAKIQAKVEEFMGHIYRFIGICLGIPPKTFTWEYYDKSKQYCVVENIKPIDFYETMVKPLYNVENKV